MCKYFYTVSRGNQVLEDIFNDGGVVTLGMMMSSFSVNTRKITTLLRDLFNLILPDNNAEKSSYSKTFIQDFKSANDPTSEVIVRHKLGKSKLSLIGL